MPDKSSHSSQHILLRANGKLNSKERHSFLKSLVAIVLVALCLIAANWQYQRGVSRHAKNYKIEKNSQLPIVPLTDIRDISASEWQRVKVSGRFDVAHEVLLRNRYNAEGKYGYEYLTLFKTTLDSTEKTFWVDRGWVQAGETASTKPVLPPTPQGEIEIIGHLRLDSSLPRGSFFAIPASGNLISQWNLKSKVYTKNFYLDLISGDGVTPKVAADLPELSDGPHMAYALQWIFFAGLIIYGRYLIRKR